ncbi:MAG TPA: hypothetical protein VGG10_05170 [Rhizomicrobium sp.]
MSYLLLYIVLALVAASTGSTGPVTYREAVRLADTVALKGPIRPVILVPFTSNPDPRFWYFEQINPDPNVSAHWQFLAVNKHTGDVWQTDGQCIHVWPHMTPKQFAKLMPSANAMPNLCDGPPISN